MKSSSVWLFFGGVILLPFIVYGIANWYDKTQKPLPVFGPADHTLLDFNLINQHGNKATLNDWKNKIVVADFFFTHCPSICPEMTKNMKIVIENFPGNDIQLASFSVDPDRDNIARLTEYAGLFNIPDGWSLLTGNKKDIYMLARKSFLVDATDGDGGQNDFIHSDRLVLIDKKKRIRGFYDGTDNSAVNQLIRDIKKLQSED